MRLLDNDCGNFFSLIFVGLVVYFLEDRVEKNGGIA